ncbi:MAG: hypothetical protein FWG23_06810 [Eggerthellaceae bacterium]|nr:hypothetical protein [Eggerthellaceae bacterium]MDR2715934.1 hypothetical protein [Coriobacteriaceae bacterium]
MAAAPAADGGRRQQGPPGFDAINHTTSMGRGGGRQDGRRKPEGAAANCRPGAKVT